MFTSGVSVCANHENIFLSSKPFAGVPFKWAFHVQLRPASEKPAFLSASSHHPMPESIVTAVSVLLRAGGRCSLNVGAAWITPSHPTGHTSSSVNSIDSLIVFWLCLKA